jgi:hypothetical protein
MPTQLEVPNWHFKLQLPISFKVAICDLKRVYFFLCTFAAIPQSGTHAPIQVIPVFIVSSLEL